jgi:hypothetical protein
MTLGMSIGPGSIKKRLLVIVTLCGAGLLISSAFAGKPSPPPPPPCIGSPIEVVDQDPCGKSLTIQVNDSAAVCNILCIWERPSKPKDRWLCPVDPLSWIGGIVVADSTAENGFYFDPNTVIVAEITAEGMQTSVCMISANPELYDGSLWYVPAHIIDVTEL